MMAVITYVSQNQNTHFQTTRTQLGTPKRIKELMNCSPSKDA